MLNLIKGRAGSGKTTYIFEKIKELSNDSQNKIILIVPEQSSFETEKNLLDFLGPVKSNNILVLSFKRLCDTVFKQYGKISLPQLTTEGKIIFMSLTLQKINDELKFFKNQYNKSDFVSKMIKSADEFKMNMIDSSALTSASHHLSGSLKLKLHDLSLIFDTYNAFISRSFVDPSDDLLRLYNILKEFAFFENSYVFIDSFKGFTCAELNIIKEIIKTAKDIFVSICIDVSNRLDVNIDLFSFVSKTEKDLIKAAKKTNSSVAKPVFLTESYRFKSDSLKALEKAYLDFAYKNSSDSDNITLFESQTLYEECEFIALSIAKLIRLNNFNFKDIVVIARNTKKYNQILTPVFDSYNIPYFDDINQNVKNKPIFLMLLSALDSALNGFNTTSIFAYLKTKLILIDEYDLSLLENYVYMWNINGKKWLLPFTGNPNGYAAKFDEDSKAELEHLNDIRKKITEPLINFKNELKNKPAKNIADIIYSFLNEIKLEENLKSIILYCKENNQLNLANEQIYLWDLLVNLLNQLHNILKEESAPLKNLYNIILLAVNSMELAHIPQVRDCVCIGSADRIRPADPKIVFILGANENEFPQSYQADSLFSNNERKLLFETGLEISSSPEEKILEERFISYLSLTYGSHQLFVTYSKNDEKMTPLSPSLIVLEIIRIFKNIKILTRSNLDYKDYIVNNKSAFLFLAKNFNENNSIINSLKHILSSSEEFSRKINAIKSIMQDRSFNFLNPAAARKLFPSKLKLSASKVDTFYSCPFKFFCKYGLNAKKRIKAELNPLEYGTLIHFLFEKFFYKNKDNLENFDKNQLKTELKKILTDYIKEYNIDLTVDEKRQEYFFNKTLKNMIILIDNIIKELLGCSFEPMEYELNIGKDIPPLTIKTDNGNLIIDGKIDRVDIMKKDGIDYIRIIDYKTGAKQFKISDILFGQNIQMFIYLLALIKNPPKDLKTVIPAGVLYFPAKSPSVSSDRKTGPLSLEKDIRTELKMNGLILNDENVIGGMLNDKGDNYLPFSLTGKGTLGKYSSVAKINEMTEILNHTEKLLINMNEKLSLGKINPTPIKTADNKYTACTYCDYSDLCPHKDTDDFIIMKNYNSEKTFKILSQNAGENNE